MRNSSLSYLVDSILPFFLSICFLIYLFVYLFVCCLKLVDYKVHKTAWTLFFFFAELYSSTYGDYNMLVTRIDSSNIVVKVHKHALCYYFKMH